MIPSSTQNNIRSSSATKSKRLSTSSVGSVDARTPGKKNRQPSSKVSKGLSRSTSIPTLKSAAMPDSESDKKRHKLTYARIAIACGHCRHRKIRCIPVEPDRKICETCVKLKKECVFHPVDQPLPARGSGSSKRSKKASSAVSSSASSSPQAALTSANDRQEQHFSTLQPLPSEPSEGYRPIDMMPAQNAFTDAQDVYGSPALASGAWTVQPGLDQQGYAVPSPNSAATGPAHTLYGDPEASATAAYSAYPGSMPATFPHAAGRGIQSWQQTPHLFQYPNVAAAGGYHPSAVQSAQNYHTTAHFNAGALPDHAQSGPYMGAGMEYLYHPGQPGSTASPAVSQSSLLYQQQMQYMVDPEASHTQRDRHLSEGYVLQTSAPG